MQMNAFDEMKPLKHQALRCVTTVRRDSESGGEVAWNNLVHSWIVI